MGCGSIPIVGPLLDPPKPKISFPGPTAAEQSVMQSQADLNRMSNQLLQEQIAETKRTRELMAHLVPSTPEEIKAYKDLQAQEQRLSKILLDKMEAEASHQPSEYEQAQERIGLAEAKRYEQALAGQLPIDEGTIQRKNQEFKALKEGMSRMGHQISGDSPENATATTTSGQQALESFRKQWGALESGIRQGAIDSGSAQMISRMGLTSDIANRDFSNQSSFRGMPQYAMSAIGAKGQYGWQPLQQGAQGLASMYSAAIDPLQWNRSAQYTGQLQTLKNKFDLYGQSMGLLSTIAGSYAGRKK